MMGGFGGCCGTGWLGGFGSFGWIGFMLNLLIAAALVIGLAVILIWFFRQMRGQQAGLFSSTNPAHSESSPREILAIRYARGEINQDQFKKMAKDLD